MHTFADRSGRVWHLDVNVASIKRVQGLTGVNMFALVSDRGMQPLFELQADVVKFVDVLYALCRAQAEAEQVTDEDFGRGLRGDPLQEAAQAFVKELIDFFPDPKVRRTLTRMVEKTERFRDRAVLREDRRLEAMTDEMMDEGIEELVRANRRLNEEKGSARPHASNGSSGSAPESSGSTRAPSP